MKLNLPATAILLTVGLLCQSSTGQQVSPSSEKNRALRSNKKSEKSNGGGGGCVKNEKQLQRAIDCAHDGRDRIEICKNTVIPINDRPINMDYLDITLACERKNCAIHGHDTPHLFEGAPEQFKLHDIEFSNDATHFKDENGGCFRFDGGKASFDKCDFDKCLTDGRGGGVAAKQTNSAGKDGGAVAFFGGKASEAYFEDCKFIKNSAKDDGGAVDDDAKSKLYFDHCDFRKNEAGNVGGAAEFEKGSQATFDYCEFKKNVAHDDGGAVAVDDAKVVFHYCNFEHNEAGDDGGCAVIELCQQ